MLVKFTQYFLYTRQRPGKGRKWGFVDEVGKYLRIVLLEDGETVHNAFSDRNFQEQGHEDQVF